MENGKRFSRFQQWATEQHGDSLSLSYWLLLLPTVKDVRCDERAMYSIFYTYIVCRYIAHARKAQ